MSRGTTRIYFPGFKKIDISRDVTFDEDSAYNKFRKRPIEDPKESEVPRTHDTTMNEENQEEDQEFEEPQEPIDPIWCIFHFITAARASTNLMEVYLL